MGNTPEGTNEQGGGLTPPNFTPLTDSASGQKGRGKEANREPESSATPCDKPPQSKGGAAGVTNGEAFKAGSQDAHKKKAEEGPNGAPSRGGDEGAKAGVEDKGKARLTEEEVDIEQLAFTTPLGAPFSTRKEANFQENGRGAKPTQATPEEILFGGGPDEAEEILLPTVDVAQIVVDAASSLPVELRNLGGVDYRAGPPEEIPPKVVTEDLNDDVDGGGSSRTSAVGVDTGPDPTNQAELPDDDAPLMADPTQQTPLKGKKPRKGKKQAGADMDTAETNAELGRGAGRKAKEAAKLKMGKNAGSEAEAEVNPKRKTRAGASPKKQGKEGNSKVPEQVALTTFTFENEMPPKLIRILKVSNEHFLKENRLQEFIDQQWDLETTKKERVEFLEHYSPEQEKSSLNGVDIDLSLEALAKVFHLKRGSFRIDQAHEDVGEHFCKVNSNGCVLHHARSPWRTRFAVLQPLLFMRDLRRDITKGVASWMVTDHPDKDLAYEFHSYFHLEARRVVNCTATQPRAWHCTLGPHLGILFALVRGEMRNKEPEEALELQPWQKLFAGINNITDQLETLKIATSDIQSDFNAHALTKQDWTTALDKAIRERDEARAIAAAQAIPPKSNDAELKILKKEKKDLEKQLQKMESEKKKVQERLDAANTELEVEKAKVEAEKARVDAEKARMEESRSSQTGLLKEKDIELQKLAKKNQSLKRKRASLTKESKKQKIKIAELQGDKEADELIGYLHD